MGKNSVIDSRMKKVGFRFGLLLTGLALYGVYTIATTTQPEDISSTTTARSLLSNDDDNLKCFDETDQNSICVGYGGDACKKLGNHQMWGLILVVAGLLYLFIGIAIVCDELFVPALEILAEDFGLSNDVAGATLMAAGGSAPELATSFVGVFKRSDVGFGTIVGSAVFNVLFVIGMCAMFTPEKYAPLKLFKWFATRRWQENVVTVKDFDDLKENQVINDILADMCPTTLE